MTVVAKKTPLVIGFVGENANGCLAVASRYINTVLASFGIEAHCINLFDPAWSDQLRALLADRTPHFCYGYAGVGAALRNGDKSFWTDYKTPFLSLMYDHPFCNLEQHTIDSPYVANCYFIADFLEVQLNYVRHPQQCFSMRDICCPIIPAGEALTKEQYQVRWRERSIPYLFIKTGNNPARLEAAIQALDPVERTIFHDCLAVLQRLADFNLTHLVAEHCRAKQIEPLARNKSFIQIVLLLERYVRDWRSQQVVEWLKHKPAVIVGDGWEHVDKTKAVAKFLPSMPATDCWGLYNDSRFVLNANPCFQDGCHDRVLSGLHCSSVVVSDRNRFSDHLFANLENFVGFDWANAHWQEQLDARLADTEATGGDFDPTVTLRHLTTQFPAQPFVVRLLTAAQKIREAA